MVGADKSTVLWWPPTITFVTLGSGYDVYFTIYVLIPINVRQDYGLGLSLPNLPAYYN